MLTTYRIVHKSSSGEYKNTYTNWFRFEYNLKENDFGSMYLDLPQIYPLSIFEIDDQFEIWRRVGFNSEYLEGDAVWLLRLIRVKTGENGAKMIHLLAHHATNLLDRRIVAYASGSAQASKTAPGDNLIRAIIRENLGSLCTDSSRNISSFLSIDVDDASSTFTTITKEFAWRKVLPLLQDIANECTAAGKYLVFDITREGNNAFEFRIYNNQRGTYRGMNSANKFIVSIPRGNMSYASIVWDNSEEFNFIYCGGSGEKDNRIVATASNTKNISISPYNRREDFISQSNSDTIAKAQSEANQRLQEAQAKIAINGHITQTADSLYGVHYYYGDVVCAEHAGISLDVHLDSVAVVVDGNGAEDLKIYTRNLEDTEY